MSDIGAIVERCRARLRMLDWRFTFDICKARDMPIVGALATCEPLPTRKLAHFSIVEPWPADESLEETIMHEATHAKLSPLTSLLSTSDASIMIEEQIVEDIGCALTQASPAMARAVALGLDKYAAPRLRARFSSRTAARSDSTAITRHSLAREGFSERWIDDYFRMTDPRARAAWLEGGRSRRAQSREYAKVDEQRARSDAAQRARIQKRFG